MTGVVTEKRLEVFQDPIRTALATYSKLTDERVVFDVDQAARLDLTPKKPNSARSKSTVQHLGETVADLYVIVFASDDCTGDENTYTLSDDIGDTGMLPRKPGIVPRSKAGVHSEAHLTIATQLESQPDSDPMLYAGSLELLSLKPRKITAGGFKVVRIAQLGQSESDLMKIGNGAPNIEAAPTATFTVGYRTSDGDGHQAGERFGDPHSVYNSFNAIQVCGFLSLTPELAHTHSSLFSDLKAVEPTIAS